MAAKCPLCNTRAAKRHCPAKATKICPVCCGTKTIINRWSKLLIPTVMVGQRNEFSEFCRMFYPSLKNHEQAKAPPEGLFGQNIGGRSAKWYSRIKRACPVITHTHNI